MNCVEAKPLVGTYIDGELDLAHSLEIEGHIADCPTCAAAHRNALALRSAVREKAPYYRASDGLRKRIAAITAAEPAAESSVISAKPVAERRPAIVPPKRSSWNWNWMGAAAAFALVLLVGLRVTGVWGPSEENMLAGEVESAHVRSLMANHLMDVPSTDQHTVKPWFHGKLDFAPPVTGFSTDGFPLVGGRLDYVDGRAVASLVYQRQQHPINVFVWPTSDKDSDVKERAHDGYNILHWTRSGMTYWAVSDLALNEMRQFANLLRR
jgi:anti-sigma factor RsiW